MYSKSKETLNIGIRADGSEIIGLGHIFRTISLANEFKKRNHNLFYFVKKNEIVYDILRNHRYQFVGIDENVGKDDEIVLMNSLLNRFQIDILIGDHQSLDQEYLNKVDRSNRLVVLIDVIRDFSIDADLIINGGIYAEDYKTMAQQYGRNVLLGPKYNLLRKQFLNLPSRKINHSVRNLLITMGGSDVNNMTIPIIKSLSELIEDITCHIVIGYSYKNISEIENIAKENNFFELHYNVEHMASLMQLSDVAIVACGTTLYELAATGTPSIGIIQAENQILQANRFADKGIILLFDGDIVFEKANFKKMVKKLILDKQMRKEMASTGQTLIDGKGSERCYEEVINTYYSNK